MRLTDPYAPIEHTRAMSRLAADMAPVDASPAAIVAHENVDAAANADSIMKAATNV